MKPKDRERAKQLDDKLRAFDESVRPLHGARSEKTRSALVEQIVDSLRRVEYAHFIRDEQFDPQRADPSSAIFDPLRAAVYWLRKGNIDEACWLIFLFVHFGKHPVDGYKLVRAVYGGLGEDRWTWVRVSENVGVFGAWLKKNSSLIRGRFGNHRKYESLNPNSAVGLDAVVASYVNWIAPPRTHQGLIREIQKMVGQEPGVVFDEMYRSMNAVLRFGRLAKFDYLTMLGKLGLAPIHPASAYLVGSTGPLRGVRLLLTSNPKAKMTAKDCDGVLRELDASLQVGMQVLEDSLCNWQKSPDRFRHFKG
jgi:hypothetical protein